MKIRTMKTTTCFLCFFFIISCTSGKEKSYIGSTPAGNVVRSFLGIPYSDSVDFIRWKITLANDGYKLQCNYGLSKPNTAGFIHDGKKIELNGLLRKEKNYYQLRNGNKVLRMVELNTDLVHLLDAGNRLLLGNAGWSYTLSSIQPSASDQIHITPKQTVLKDSMAFEGRTPCFVPGIIAPGALCYKLKWYIVLYADVAMHAPAAYKIFGTPYRKEGSRKGNWKLITGKDGRIIYQLNDEKGNGFLFLLKIDEHILVFTDAQGKLLTGDADFSYTLNRTTSP